MHDQELDGRYRVEVIGLMKHPELPATTKSSRFQSSFARVPEPMKRITVDLSSTEKFCSVWR
ncbi:hypothetical protein [Candidatus Binatus sp.]|uniref:hypothetical protein n=1 Tax=Candidatus Binatus sp. TaxID=2811406 RepID=UPI00351D6DE6